MMKKTSIAAVLSTVMAICPAARADEAPPQKEGSYAYHFDDDPFLPQPPNRCLPRPNRNVIIIIRPRAHFVRELIETVEKL